MLKELKSKSFKNGRVFLLETEDGYKIETTDTFLPYYTKNCINGTNALNDYEVGDRTERWMVGVSVMSGCPVRCKFCATGNMKRFRNLTANEIIEQVEFILMKNPNYDPNKSKEFKINYTRMGEPFLNVDAVKKAINTLSAMYPNVHHYVSTIGIKDSDFSWIKGNITLQVSVHSLDTDRRNWLIPFKNKMEIKDLGQIRVDSKLKTTVNLTLVKDDDFDIVKLKEYFDPNKFFIKLSPINMNEVSKQNNLGAGIVEQVNLI